MNVLEFIILVVMAGVLGVVAQQILGTRYGVVVSVIFGFIGALVGRQLAIWLGLPVLLTVGTQSGRFEVVWSLLGALLVTFGAGIIAKSNRNAQKKK
jgi:uncharacterized membrane protein YeaQ/YmgE (transglycosylase-associated protein family)